MKVMGWMWKQKHTELKKSSMMGPPRFELGSPAFWAFSTHSAPQAGRITRLPYGPLLLDTHQIYEVYNTNPHSMNLLQF